MGKPAELERVGNPVDPEENGRERLEAYLN
jgi:hypothetical protein